MFAYLVRSLILLTLASTVIAFPLGPLKSILLYNTNRSIDVLIPSTANNYVSIHQTSNNATIPVSAGGRIGPFKDLLHAGPFQIAQCTQGTGEQAFRAHKLAYILEYIRLRVRDAVTPDLQQAGLSSKHGFTTIFKDSSPQDILPIFQHIVDGDVKFPSPPVFRFTFRSHKQLVFFILTWPYYTTSSPPLTAPNKRTPKRVTFICANPDEPSHWGFDKQCSKTPPWTAYAHAGTEAIVDCSNCDYGVAPARLACPVVKGDNKMFPNDDDFVHAAGFGIFIHELAHTYGILDWDNPEVYPIQDAAELDGLRQSLNAQSLCLFCKW